jgi:predicted dehydrogenase
VSNQRTQRTHAETGVAIVGCGVISPEYAYTLNRLGFVDVSACADAIPERAAKLAAAHGIPRALTFDQVLADPEIGTVVNLTPPVMHAEVTRAALEAGKAAFSEKPLGIDFAEGRDLVDCANRLGLRLGCAPDTFLGVGFQTCRDVIERGLIGEPIGANAFTLGSGPESWHPNPDIFYQRGAGPMFDMGPYYLTALVSLLGPAKRVTASARITHARRTISSEPRRGELVGVEVPTHVATVIDFASGPVATVVTSFDVQASRYRNIEIYGTEATLSVPNPNTFEGPVTIRGVADTSWTEIELRRPYIPQHRGIGLADMIWATRTGRAHRASSTLALHVLELMTASVASSEQGRHIELQTTCRPAKSLPAELPENTFDDA